VQISHDAASGHVDQAAVGVKITRLKRRSVKVRSSGDTCTLTRYKEGQRPNRKLAPSWFDPVLEVDTLVLNQLAENL
jgi:hypothetical protein